jgi:uncharacterized protein with PIN domain
MIFPCSSCGYKLWSVERDVDGRFVRVHFDGENTSETYAQQVTHCPRCNKWLQKPAAEETHHLP